MPPTPHPITITPTVTPETQQEITFYASGVALVFSASALFGVSLGLGPVGVFATLPIALAIQGYAVVTMARHALSGQTFHQQEVSAQIARDMAKAWTNFVEPFANMPPIEEVQQQQYMEIDLTQMFAQLAVDVVTDAPPASLSSSVSTGRAQEAAGRASMSITMVGGPQPIGMLPMDAPVASTGQNSTPSPNGTFGGRGAASLADMTTAGIFGGRGGSDQPDAPTPSED